LLRDQLRIALSPGKVVLERLARGLHPKVAARHVVACADSAQDEAPWAKVLEALESGLQKEGGAKSDAQIVLSNHFVRYALVPWSDQISDQEEEQAFIRLCFTKTYGADAQHWALRMSPNGFGESQVACAIDQGLLDGLERVVTAHGAKLVSLQPYLMAMFNQWRQELPDSSAWFVVAEPGRLCVSQLQKGRWQTLRTVKAGGDWCQALQKLLEREYLISESGMERGAVYLCTPASVAAADLPGWEAHQLGAVQDGAEPAGIHSGKRRTSPLSLWERVRVRDNSLNSHPHPSPLPEGEGEKQT